MAQSVLALNADASGIKLAVFEMLAAGRLGRAATGQVTGIGGAAHFLAQASNGRVLAEQSWPGGGSLAHEDLLPAVLEFAEHLLGHDTLQAVGHRVTHGGASHIQPQTVTEKLITTLEELVPLAPRHQPHSLAPMRAVAKLRPNLLQIACFDTAFHHTMPPVATRFALPRSLHEAGVRRYGFHGLSYEYVAETLKQEAPKLAAARVIVAHLGSGASVCAMQGGRSVDTSMGFTVLDGPMMGTRCGTIGPGVVLHLQLQLGMTAQAVEDLLYEKSGLLGVSGISGDMRMLSESRDPRAAEANAVFELLLLREIGALSAILGGVEALVFTGGIGVHMPRLRKNVCDRLHIPLDGARNEKGLGKISAADAGLEVWVIPTDEEAMVARHAATCWHRDQARRNAPPMTAEAQKAASRLFGTRRLRTARR